MITSVADRLAALVRETAANVPFYRRFWGEARIADVAAHGAEGFAALPLLRKADLLSADPAELLHAGFRAGKLAWEQTSGSSGQPFEMPLDRASLRRRRARFLRALLDSGYRPGRRLMLISSQPSSAIERRQVWMQRLGWHYADLDQSEGGLLEEYQRVRPHVLYGPMSALLHLGEDLGSRPVDGHRPDVIISTGEQLMPQHRRLLEEAFGANVTDFYGMSEFGLISWRRATDDRYRTPGGPFHMEFMPSSVETGLDALVVTGVHGGALPLVRYETGDLVRRERDAPDASIVEFVGRSMDALRLPGGRTLSPYRLVVALEAIPRVEEYRVLQQPDGSVDVSLRCRAADAGGVVRRAEEVMMQLCAGLTVRICHDERARARPEGKIRPIRSLARAPA